MILLPKARLAGRFRLDAVRLDANGAEISRRQVSDWMDNLILDNGKNLLGSGTTLLGNMSVGTSNTAPAPGQTALIGFLASTNTLQGSPSSGVLAVSPYYSFYIITRRFAAAPVNWNINEVGIGPSTGGTNLFSRALTVNGVGVPTTLTILAGEILDMTYELRVYPPIGADVTGTITISGTNYNYTIRACRVGSGVSTNGGWGVPDGTSDGWNNILSVKMKAWSGSIGAITANPTGTSADVNSGFTDLAYTNGNFYRDHQVIVALNAGNVAGGIKSLNYLFNWGSYQIEFSANIPKDATRVLTLVFRHAWV